MCCVVESSEIMKFHVGIRKWNLNHDCCAVRVGDGGMFMWIFPINIKFNLEFCVE